MWKKVNLIELYSWFRKLAGDHSAEAGMYFEEGPSILLLFNAKSIQLSVESLSQTESNDKIAEYSISNYVPNTLYHFRVELSRDGRLKVSYGDKNILTYQHQHAWLRPLNIGFVVTHGTGLFSNFELFDVPSTFQGTYHIS